MAELQSLNMYPLILNHYILVGSSTVTRWTSPFVIFWMSGPFCQFYSIFNGKSCKQTMNTPDQTPDYVASALDLHCLPMVMDYGSVVVGAPDVYWI